MFQSLCRIHQHSKKWFKPESHYLFTPFCATTLRSLHWLCFQGGTAINWPVYQSVVNWVSNCSGDILRVDTSDDEVNAFHLLIVSRIMQKSDLKLRQYSFKLQAHNSDSCFFKNAKCACVSFSLQNFFCRKCFSTFASSISYPHIWYLGKELKYLHLQ